MSRRIEIELTSARPDGTWTWRAAGARQPKGVLDGGLLYEGAKAGDVLKAEAEFELEGIGITSVAAPKGDARAAPETIEGGGPGRPDGPGVTTQLVGRADRRDRRGDDDRRRERRPVAGGGEGRPRREGGPPARGDDRGRRPSHGERDGRSEHAPGAERGPDERGRPRDGAGGRPPRPAGERRPPRSGERPEGPVRTSSQADRAERAERADRADRGQARRR